MIDDRSYAIVASVSEYEHAERLSDIVRKRIYGDEEWVEHLEDVIAYSSNTSFVLVDSLAWEACSEKDMILEYCRGYADAASQN